MLDYVATRLQAALAKLDGKTDAASVKRRKDLADRYQLSTILEKGLRVAGFVEVVTHTAKGIHPDLSIKDATNLRVNFADLPKLDGLVDSSQLPDAALDITGNGAYNAAGYDLALLLFFCRFENTRLIDLIQQGDADAIAVFNECAQDEAGADKALTLLESKCPVPSTDTLAKQVYWLAGDDACDDQQYVLLIFLYPTLMSHRLYQEANEARFGKANQAAREAMRGRKNHDGVLLEYPNLAVQAMGGTKPHNISHLNSERLGRNYLLASLPPAWRSSSVALPAFAASVFDKAYPSRLEVRRTIRALRRFLAGDPPSNHATRQKREQMVDALISELAVFAEQVQHTLPPGWSREERFADLQECEQLWLDPLRATLPGEEEFAGKWEYMDWPAELGKTFARWLNTQLEDGAALIMSDVEATAWRKVLLTDEGGFKQHLREMRTQLGAPHSIPIRHTHAELAQQRGVPTDRQPQEDSE